MTARTPLELLELARARDILLAVEGEDLIVDAPQGVLTAELSAALVAQKPALRALLAPGGPLVALKGGLCVPAAALVLVLDLEDRGIHLQVSVDHQLVLPTDPRLSPADQAAIFRWRPHLAALVEYRPPDFEVPQ